MYLYVEFSTIYASVHTPKKKENAIKEVFGCKAHPFWFLQAASQAGPLSNIKCTMIPIVNTFLEVRPFGQVLILKFSSHTKQLVLLRNASA